MASDRAAISPQHLPSIADIEAWPEFTAESPMRILVSGCVAGLLCGYDGTSYGEYELPRRIFARPNVCVTSFCPEDSQFGTPRELCNIHGGTGFDVLDGRARVLTESGSDWTDRMIRAANEMLLRARQNSVHLALLMDISAACGSQVIYDGVRANQKYQRGAGVCAALLMRNGYKVVSQRDDRTLHTILRKLDHQHAIDSAAVDHHEREWYRTYFAETT
ncbi:MAG TPA: DUF523 domain-containing protein [Thermoanaerobaculia bacterium]|nr:DUF523 domain-containing protein [Thermoanaerobaculia bacterium]